MKATTTTASSSSWRRTNDDGGNISSFAKIAAAAATTTTTTVCSSTSSNQQPEQQPSIRSQYPPPPPLYITIGPPCSGKTTLLSRLQQKLTGNNTSTSAILDVTLDDQPGVYVKIPLELLLQNESSSSSSSFGSRRNNNNSKYDRILKRRLYGKSIHQRLYGADGTTSDHDEMRYLAQYFCGRLNDEQLRSLLCDGIYRTMAFEQLLLLLQRKHPKQVDNRQQQRQQQQQQQRPQERELGGRGPKRRGEQQQQQQQGRVGHDEDAILRNNNNNNNNGKNSILLPDAEYNEQEYPRELTLEDVPNDHPLIVLAHDLWNVASQVKRQRLKQKKEDSRRRTSNNSSPLLLSSSSSSSSSSVLFETSTVDLFVVEALFRVHPKFNLTGVEQAHEQLFQYCNTTTTTTSSSSSNSTPRTGGVSWGNTNTRPREYKVALEAAEASGRPVYFIVYASRDDQRRIKNGLWLSATTTAGASSSSPSSSSSSDTNSQAAAAAGSSSRRRRRRELLRRNLIRFLQTGKFIPARSIMESTDRVEQLVADVLYSLDKKKKRNMSQQQQNDNDDENENEKNDNGGGDTIVMLPYCHSKLELDQELARRCNFHMGTDRRVTHVPPPTQQRQQRQHRQRLNKQQTRTNKQQ